MADTKQVDAGSVKKGDTILIDGSPCRISGIQISRPGKHGHAKCRIEGVGLFDEKKRVIVVPGHEKLHSPVVEKRTAQVLSVSGSSANVMDMETFETFDLSVPDELKESVVEGVQVLYWKVMEEMVMKQVKT